MIGQFDYSDLQFGFVQGRSTQMASVLTNDVISYCTSRGSTVYTCSLDAEGAFDSIPHPVLFQKAMGAVPDHCWRILVYWYGRLSVQVKWGNSLSVSINVNKGTRQGGLSSPLLFNVFYRDLVNILSETSGGICINGLSYNVFCYADDLLVASLTASGLQDLINVANEYIANHGLRFNPNKTECTVFGVSHLVPHPRWILNDVPLSECDTVKYLGVNLSYTKPNTHVDNRIKSCRNAYYALQGVGLCNKGMSADASAYLWNTALRPILTYGIQCVDISKKALLALEKMQTKLIKSAVGVHKFCRNTPLLNALGIRKIETSLDISCLELLRTVFKVKSRATQFYKHLMNVYICDNKTSSRCSSLIARAHVVCKKHDISFVKYIVDDKYSNIQHLRLKRCFSVNDGLSDTVRQLLLSFNPYDRTVLNMMLIPF